MQNETIVRILTTARVIAVVGCSRYEHKAAHRIPAEMQAVGYTIVPVHPSAETLLGVPAYRRLADIPFHVDVVDVFRPSAEAPAIAEEAVAIGASALWLQLGLRSDAAAATARAAGLDYVENRCISVERAIRGILPRQAA
jgi:predicted CoA-binding protein